MQKPRILPHPTTKQGVLFLCRMGFPAQKKMIYYTSDLHFGQKSLLATGKWKERPFETLEEMHASQIKRWNDKVTNGDDVYIAGDVGARGYHNMLPELLAQLKGCLLYTSDAADE